MQKSDQRIDIFKILPQFLTEKICNKFEEEKKTYKVACPKFELPALSSEFYNYILSKEFMAAVGMLHSKDKTISKLSVRIFAKLLFLWTN